MKIRILEDFVGNIDGQSIVFKKGQEVDLSDERADNFVRGKYAEYLKKPAVKVVEKPEQAKAIKIKR